MVESLLALGAANPLPPFALFFAGALLLAVLPHRLRVLPWLLVPALSALTIASYDHGVVLNMQMMGLSMDLVEVDKLSIIFGYLFSLAALIGGIFSLHLDDRLQHVSQMAYAGTALGAVFSGDLLSLFLFWEGMVATSVFLIYARRSPTSVSVAQRYLLFQVTSGVLLLAAAIFMFQESGSYDFTAMTLETPAGVLLFLAFGIKAAFPFLHTWMTDAYAEGTVTGAVFLSSLTTKTAIYCLARGYAGTDILIWVGVVMAAMPIFYAVIENDLRKVLAYSLMNQLGFMIVGIGIGTELALNGTVSHAFSHVLYKSLLFMSMGAVLYMTGKIDGSDLGGLYKSMPFTTVFCIIGAASISAFPLLSGFISKSMIITAAIKADLTLVWCVLLFASAGVFHHAGIKIPYFAFFAHDSGIRTSEAPLNMLIAMAIAATFCILIGSFPSYLYSMLPWEVDYWPYDYTHVVSQLQLLMFSALAFVWLNLRGIYPPEIHGVNLDSDWFLRRLIPAGIRRVGAPLLQGFINVRGVAAGAVQRLYAVTGQRLTPEREYQWVSDIGIIITVLTLGFAVLLSY